MAFADKLKGLFKQGEGAVKSHQKEAHQAVDKVAAEASKRTGGKYDGQIDAAEKKADEAIDQMGGAGEPGHGGQGGAGGNA
jgi:MT0933-like antitoxin protein